MSAPTAPSPWLSPLTATAPLNVTTSNALRVSDAYACIRVLADSISSLPLHAYRRTEQGRLPAGENARSVQLLRKPAPGSTGVDLISQIVVHLNVYGEAFVGKYRADGEIVQLGLLHPESVQVELRGQRIVYTLDSIRGRTATAFVRSTLRARALAAWTAAELEPLTPHEARHCCASYLAAAGLTPKEMQTAMGHADIRTTMNIYAKAVPGWEEGATAKLDAYLDAGQYGPVASPAERLTAVPQRFNTAG